MNGLRRPLALKGKHIHWFDGRLVTEGRGEQTVKQVLKWRLLA